jgi:hypothetical protein
MVQRSHIIAEVNEVRSFAAHRSTTANSDMNMRLVLVLLIGVLAATVALLLFLHY